MDDGTTEGLNDVRDERRRCADDDRVCVCALVSFRFCFVLSMGSRGRQLTKGAVKPLLTGLGP